MTYAPEIPAEEWHDETTCPNCASHDIVEFGFRVVGSPAPARTGLECRDCGAYSTWRLSAPREK